MALSPFLIRRGKRYSWRREIRGITLQVPLFTDRPEEARAIAATATAASVQAFEALIAGRLDRSAARAMIESAVRYEAARQTMRKGAPHMFFFWTREMVEKHHPEQLEAWDKAQAELEAAQSGVSVPSSEGALESEPAPAAEVSPAAIAAATSHASPTVIVQNHYHAVPGFEPQRQPEPLALSPSPAHVRLADEVPENWEWDESDDGAAPAPAPKATPRPQTPKPQTGTPILPVIARIIEKDRKYGKINEESAVSFERVVRLFCEITGCEHVEDITQERLAAFVDAHELVPLNYRKSAAEKDRPIWDIINEAEAEGRETGLSVSTINRNLTQMSKFFKYAKSFGITVSGCLEPSLLRIPDKEAAKDKRKAFTLEDIRKIFAHPNLNLDADRDPLFWIAHAAAYTGARREEIAGLDAADIETRNGVPFFNIRNNAHRTLKNGQSQRLIPLHRDLISLGLHEYAKERKGQMLFDLRKKSYVSSYGDGIDHRWRKAMTESIGTGHRKAFHSLRHSAIDYLMKAKVDINTRGAIFGHLTGHIEGDIYGGDAEFGDLLDAVNLLPSVR